MKTPAEPSFRRTSASDKEDTMRLIFVAVAEFENKLRKERQIEGIAKAKKNSVHFGRKAKLTLSRSLRCVTSVLRGS